MVGKLYIVATPIGNLEDVSLRCIKILKDVDYIIAEDTRVTHKLLAFVNSQFSILNSQANNSQKENETIQKLKTAGQKLISYHQHSREAKKLEILNYLMNGFDIVLVTDAGTPGISDPGNELIDWLLSYNPEIEIIPIPGASAITTAISVAGFRADKFVFLGFLPKKKRSKLFAWLREGKMTFAFYESPNRITKTLETLEKAFGPGIRVFIGRELTKLYETHYRGTLKEVSEKLKEKKVKGEIVAVVEL